MNKQHKCMDCGEMFEERIDEYGDIEDEICFVCEMQRNDQDMEDMNKG